MRDKIYRFMQGRYGTDDFYKFLFWVALIGIVINWFFKSQLLSFAVTLILIYAVYRVLSRNHSARYTENQKYLNATAKFRYWFDQQKSLWRSGNIIISIPVRNADRRSGFPKVKERLWCAALNVIMNFRRGADRCSDILWYISRN